MALKTVGLLTMMAQSGLHVPVDKDSELAIFADILADIGDGQSIEQSLSTFSSHIRNIIDILNCADEHSLVIIDEIGSGTDPGEGMGLAVSVLEELNRKKATILATTHYSEIKDFARTRKGFINGSMEFDINTLKPLYRLHIGMEGESNAFLIALRLGMDSGIIARAHEVTYREKKDYSGITWSTAVNISKASAEEEDTDADVADQQLRFGDSEAMELAHRMQVQKLKQVEKKLMHESRQKEKAQFNLGDNVYISFMERTGIICELENSRGEYGVMVMKKKLKINKKRLALYISGDEMYPEDYDYDIVFDTKQNRKNKHLLSRKHADGVEIIIK